MDAVQIKTAVEHDIAEYCSGMRNNAQSFDAQLREATEYFLEKLEHTNSLQAQLVIAGYQLCGGKDTDMTLVAARAIHMTHVYALLCATHNQHMAAALNGQHAAQILLANVSAPDELRLKAVSITNRALLLYMHGIASEDKLTPAMQDCFATELTLNPLHVGMVLAGADCAATDEITAFALTAGRAMLSPDKQQVAEYRLKARQEFAAIKLWNSAELATISELCDITA
jgi:hypothetical protein